MAGEDDVELRDLVAHTLETRGVLGSIRAQLRANVFLALEEQESQQKPHPLVSSRFQDYLKTKNGKIATALVREFLNFFDLDYTCSVFDPETNALEVCPVRDELARDLGLDNATSTGPLLDSLLQRATSSTPFQQPVSSASLTSTPRQHQENSDATAKGTNTTSSPQTQPSASGSVPANFANDSPRIFANPTQAGTTSGADFSPFDQFLKPGSLTENSDDGSGLVLVHKTTKISIEMSGPEGDRISVSQGKTKNSGVVKVERLSSSEERVNGKDVDDLDDFFDQREGKGAHKDDVHGDQSFSEHSDAAKSVNKFEETEDMTLSQNSLTAEFDYAEPART